jgi:hypothetical protein
MRTIAFGESAYDMGATPTLIDPAGDNFINDYVPLLE